ncbi:ATPase [Wansuia hejianensis]|uniref:ATPase n=1 Tax=Wansuia hejianensis TaxID=2763667 RepID=A0A926EY66_9FIRM|nr:ATPase [Wansuia hejianensis]MBC8590528.1 ATPase [Wansuia hejianensis]
MINDINVLKEEIELLKDFVSKEQGKREKLLEQLNNDKTIVLSLQGNIELLEKVIVLFQKTSEFAREQAKTQIEGLVTKCLQFIFESNIEFEIEIEELRNKSSAEFYVTTESNDLKIRTKPELARGGGVVDIVSLALRVAFLQVHKPRIEGPLILDEPAKHVSEDYIYNVGDFLKQTAEMFNRQIIMITHNQHLAALGDNSYRIDLVNDISYIARVEP